MYIKLNFTAGKPLNYIFRIVNEIINTTGITSVATLQSTATSGSWNSNLLSTLDATNSEIIRTGTGTTALTTANTKSHYSKNGTSTTYDDEHEWTVEFSNYDDTTKKYYVQHKNVGGASSTTTTPYLGTSITSGAMTTGQMAPTVAPLASSSVGTAIVLGGTTQAGSQYVASGTSGFTTVTSFTMYITDTAMVWSATCTNVYNLGFGNTYSNSAGFIGPFIYSQYNRFDYHNTNANGIFPLAYTNMNRGVGVGFGSTTADWITPENNQATAVTTQAFKVLNLVNAYPTVGVSFPVVTFPPVNWGIGSRYSDYAGLTVAGAGSATVAGTAAYGPVLFTTVSTRYPSADLKTQTFGMLPVSWRNLYYYNAGGDMSAKGGWYLFNGDYFPGDEYSYGGKTYKILPTWSGYSNRIGIAIPKE